MERLEGGASGIKQDRVCGGKRFEPQSPHEKKGTVNDKR